MRPERLRRRPALADGVHMNAQRECGFPGILIFLEITKQGWGEFGAFFSSIVIHGPIVKPARHRGWLRPGFRTAPNTTPSVPSNSPEQAIKDALSAARLATFEAEILAPAPLQPGAPALYTWNAQVSAAMLGPLHMCEVVVRNDVWEALSTVYAADESKA